MAEEPKAPAGSGPEKAAEKPTAAKPPAKPSDTPEPWADPLRDALEKRFPSALSDALVFRNQPSITVAKNSLLEVCGFLRDDAGAAYTYPTDVTAVDYPGREKRFEVIYHLYSFERNDRLRVKVLVGDGEPTPSLAGLWSGVDWQEREVFDMFGIKFEGHPNLKRILLPEDWVGYPLRKDYDILKQDTAWVQANLKIESGQ